ncbi:aminopeptidase [Butyrivibrio proteoclasticus]|uniref:aminopeptidase n=1 Tax=Butyrivibrio proteoclasticus TaxID=43305 RepID=UPI00047B4215|nr:aminopeptidase [Butyrivibrio proteoclasticus]
MNQNIINKMIDAMKITSKDTVLLNYWSEGDDADLRLFEKTLQEKELKYKTINFTEEYLTSLANDGPAQINEDFFKPYDDCTIVVDVLQRLAGMPPKNLPKEKYGDFSEVLRKLFGFMSQHEKLIQITMPSRTNAALAGEDFEEYKTKVEKALDIDYSELEKSCQSKINSITSKQITVKTGKSSVLTMDITGREWNIDAGEGAFPCGEVYIAPVEDRTNGEIFFEKFFLEDAGSFNNITLKVENGKVVESDCADLNELLSQQDEGARIVGELGIGLNPAVEYSGKGAALDEDALGTFHIGLGMNFLFGGNNKTRFHMDFVNVGEIG